MKSRRGVFRFKESVIWAEDRLRTPELRGLVGPASEKAVPPATTTMNSEDRELEALLLG